MEQIGGPQDTSNLKESMNELIHRCNGLSKKTNTMLKELVTVSNDYVCFIGEFSCEIILQNVIAEAISVAA